MKFRYFGLFLALLSLNLSGSQVSDQTQELDPIIKVAFRIALRSYQIEPNSVKLIRDDNLDYISYSDSIENKIYINQSDMPYNSKRDLYRIYFAAFHEAAHIADKSTQKIKNKQSTIEQAEHRANILACEKLIECEILEAINSYICYLALADSCNVDRFDENHPPVQEQLATIIKFMEQKELAVFIRENITNVETVICRDDKILTVFVCEKPIHLLSRL